MFQGKAKGPPNNHFLSLDYVFVEVRLHLLVKGVPLVAEVAGDGEPAERPEVHRAGAHVYPNHRVLENYIIFLKILYRSTQVVA